MTRIPSISACMYQPELFFEVPTDELERLQLRYPYFADIPALLAKKYQLEGDMRANSQLVRAALYSSDRALLMKWMTMHLQANVADPAPIQTITSPEKADAIVAEPAPIEKEAKQVEEIVAIPSEETIPEPIEAKQALKEEVIEVVAVDSTQKPETPQEESKVILPKEEEIKLELTEKPKKKRGPKKPGHDIDWEALYEDAKKPNSQDARLKALDDELDALIRSAATLAATDRDAYFSDEYVELEMEGDEIIDLSFFDKNKKKPIKEHLSSPAPQKPVVEVVSKVEKKEPEAQNSQVEMSNEGKKEQNQGESDNKAGLLGFLKQHSKGSAIGQNRTRTHASQLRKVMDEFVQSFEEAASGVDNPQVDVLEMSVYGLQEHDDFITETMAEMLVKQEKYEKAIVAFEKLRLLKPEKSVLFASRISEIKNKLNQV